MPISQSGPNRIAPSLRAAKAIPLRDLRARRAKPIRRIDVLDDISSPLSHEFQRRLAVRTGLIDWATQVLEPLDQAPAQHHLLLLQELDAVARGRVDRLMVLMPPGSAKSTYASVIFPVWWFGLHPRSSVIAASHTAGLAEHFGRRARDLIFEQGAALGLTLVQGYRSVARWGTSLGGEYTGVGLHGSVTGRRADLILIDDPVKSQADAESRAVRDRTWAWFRSDLMTRLTPRGRVVVIMTRWHEDDLGGQLLDRSESDWRVLRLPAFAEAGDPLHRELGAPLWPEWENAAALLRRRETVGERAWSALYQQAPRPIGGALFKVDCIDFVDSSSEFDRPPIVRAWDLAATAKGDDNDPDWTVGLKLHRDPSGRFVVLDVVRSRGSPWQVERTLADTARRDGTDVRISLPQDPGSAGKVAASNYVALLAGYHVETSAETGSKDTRALAVAAQLEAGNLALVRGEWNKALVDELRDFPFGKKDDQVDALSRAFWRLVGTQGQSRRMNVGLLER